MKRELLWRVLRSEHMPIYSGHVFLSGLFIKSASLTFKCLDVHTDVHHFNECCLCH
ncbi:hypothetical protein LINGRAHAP2_LOCUS32220 [Linum grandiflorum]